MSNIVDNKIVEMQFDNKNFEKNVEQSIATLEDLKKELKLEDAADGFNEIDKAAKNMDLSSISESIQSISDRFSTMGIVAMTVISEITTSVLHAVTNIASTVGGLIAQGGLTRALNIEKAKFQLEGLGVAWEDIYDNIDKAVSGTAYSLDAAALVASQLVASGVEYGDELSGMAVSLRAISGVAAMTSSSYSEIGEIFTTVAGQGKLMTMQLRQLESRGLNAAATLAKQLGKSEAEVREMVTAGKIDFLTFSTAMNDAFGDHAMEANKTLTGVLANTKSALGRIGAEFLSPIIQNEGPLVNMFESLRVKINEIKAAITPLAEIVSKSIIGYILRLKTIIDGIEISDNIYPLIMTFQTLDNVASFCELTLKKLASVFGIVKEAFKEIFPNSIITSIAKLTTEFIDFYGTFELTADEADKLKRAFKGFFAIVDIGVQAIKGLIKPFLTILGISGNVADGFLDASANLGDFLVLLDETIKSSKVFDEIGRLISTTILNIASAVSSAINYISSLDFSKYADKIKEVLSKIGKLIYDSISKLNLEGLDMSGIDNFITAIKNAETPIEAFKITVTSLFDAIKNVFEWLVNNLTSGLNDIDFSSFKNNIAEITAGLDPIAAFGVIVSETFDAAGRAFIWFMKTAQSVVKPIASAIGEVISAISNFFTGGGDLLESLKNTTIGVILYQLKSVLFQIRKLCEMGDPVQTFKQSMETLSSSLWQLSRSINAAYFLSLAVAVLILAAALTQLSELDTDQLSKGLTGVSTLMIELAAISKWIGKDLKNIIAFQQVANCLIEFAGAILILALATKMLSSLSVEELAKGLIAVGVLLTELTAVCIVLGREETTLIKGTSALILMAVALRILVGAVERLGALDFATLAKGFYGVTVLLAELSIVAIALSGVKGFVASSIGMIAMAAAICILASAVEKLGNLDFKVIAKGLFAVTVLLAELTAFSALASISKGLISTGIGMIAIAAAILILTQSVKQLGSMKVSEIAKGLIALQIVMIELAAFSATVSLLGSSILSGVALLAMAAAILVIVGALQILANMESGGLKQSLASLAILLLELSVAVNAMSTGIVGAAALLIMAAALTVLMIPLVALSNLPAKALFATLGAVALGLGILIGAAALASLVAPGLFTLSAALLAVGAATALVGIGITAVGVGLTSIAAALLAFSKAGPAAVNASFKSIKAVVTNILTFLPDVIRQLSESFVAFLDTLKTVIPSLIGFLKELFTSICELIVTLSPNIASTVLSVLAGILQAITEYLPTILTFIGTILVEILNGLTEWVPQIVAAAMELICAFIQAIADSQVQLIQAAFDAMISFINGLADAIDQNMPLVVAAMNRLFDSVVRAAVLVLTNSYTQFKEKGKQLIIHLKTGITGQISNAKNAMSTVINGVKNTITTKVSDFTTVGKNIVQGLINGLNAMLQSAIDTASALGTKILNAAKASLGIQSPSKKFKEVGKFVDLGLIKGMQEYSGKVEEASKEIATSTYETMSDALSGVSNIVSDLDGEPVITPVIDTTKMGYIDDVNAASNIRLNADVDTSFNKPIETLSQIFEAAKAEIKDSNQKVIDSVNGLKDDLTELLSTDQELGLYVDGKKLASTLAKPMNRQLNVLATRGAY